MGQEPELTELIDPSEYTFLDSILHYSLFIGAIFQLFCIFAVVFYTPSDNEESHNGIEETDEKSQVNKSQGQNVRRRTPNEKKKKK